MATNPAPWRIEDEAPSWLGPVSSRGVDALRRWARKLAIRELWYSEESRTLTGDACVVTVSPHESVASAFGRLLRAEDDRQRAEREERDRPLEAHESIERRVGEKP